MERPNEIQLTVLEHQIDAIKAAGLVCPEGKVMVEMLPETNVYRGLFLPDQIAANMRPDVGIVLACGPDIELSPGDMVAVRGYAGQWLEEFEAVSRQSSVVSRQPSVDPEREKTPSVVYRTENQVRVYGKYSPSMGVVRPDPWSASIPVILFPETEDMTATHNNLIVKRDPPITQEGSLLLVDGHEYRDGFAEVLAIGPTCKLATVDGAVQLGDRIHYDTRGELAFAFGGDPDLAIIPDVAVNFVVRDQVAAVA